MVSSAHLFNSKLASLAPPFCSSGQQALEEIPVCLSLTWEGSTRQPFARASESDGEEEGVLSLASMLLM